MINAAESLTRLRDGNQRFVSGALALSSLASRIHRESLAARQEPFAIVLSCSDSRVPAEFVFDQGFGDLFVIRVAGNIVAPSQVGSVEYAAAQFGSKLVVVMGHEGCGAITAAFDELTGQAPSTSRNIRSIVDRVRPSVETVFGSMPGAERTAIIQQAVRANVRASANHLRHASEILERMSQEEGLVVVGAVYSLQTGVVDFFDGV